MEMINLSDVPDYLIPATLVAIGAWFFMKKLNEQQSIMASNTEKLTQLIVDNNKELSDRVSKLEDKYDECINKLANRENCPD